MYDISLQMRVVGLPMDRPNQSSQSVTSGPVCLLDVTDQDNLGADAPGIQRKTPGGPRDGRPGACWAGFAKRWEGGEAVLPKSLLLTTLLVSQKDAGGYEHDTSDDKRLTGERSIVACGGKCRVGGRLGVAGRRLSSNRLSGSLCDLGLLDLRRLLLLAGDLVLQGLLGGYAFCLRLVVTVESRGVGGRRSIKVCLSGIKCGLCVMFCLLGGDALGKEGIERIVRVCVRASSNAVFDVDGLELSESSSSGVRCGLRILDRLLGVRDGIICRAKGDSGIGNCCVGLLLGRLGGGKIIGCIAQGVGTGLL